MNGDVRAETPKGNAERGQEVYISGRTSVASPRTATVGLRINRGRLIDARADWEKLHVYDGAMLDGSGRRQAVTTSNVGSWVGRLDVVPMSGGHAHSSTNSLITVGETDVHGLRQLEPRGYHRHLCSDIRKIYSGGTAGREYTEANVFSQISDRAPNISHSCWQTDKDRREARSHLLEVRATGSRGQADGETKGNT